ncbi:MAG: tRNA (adenosine(37)-N6)-threonylcarbamoyltransferase complex ATPase subunit type 1 TsaE, partial [Patescibacteria group bacterium]
FYHVDLYRLTSLEEAKAIGIEEMWDNNNVVVIEWPEIIEKILPKHIKVKFTQINENERQIIY